MQTTSLNVIYDKCLINDTVPAFESLACPDVGAVIFENFFSSRELEEMLEKIYALKPEWQKGAGPGDYTVGNVWYAFIAFDRELEYFGLAEQSRAYIEKHFPGLEKRVLDFCEKLVGAPVIIRPGWSGPAFVNFTCGSETALEGGQLHTDHDGLPDDFLMSPQAVDEAFSFILPLQLPEQKGNLFVWPDIFDADNKEKYLCGSFEDLDEPDGEAQELVHKAGNLMAIKSLRVHQIDGFSGQTERITLNFRLTKLHGTWTVWF